MVQNIIEIKYLLIPPRVYWFFLYIQLVFDTFPATTLTKNLDSEPPSILPVTVSQETLLAMSALLERERTPPSYKECMICLYWDFVFLHRAAFHTYYYQMGFI
jgi:hypothetical protein